MDPAAVKVDDNEEPVFPYQVDGDDPPSCTRRSEWESPALDMVPPCRKGLWVHDPDRFRRCHPGAASPSSVSAHVSKQVP
eukprot:3934353-Rhodomonas_salina.3